MQQISSETVLLPAYGRKYDSLTHMKADWDVGKDFKIGPNGPYCSIRDIEYLKNSSSQVTLTQDYHKYIKV